MNINEYKYSRAPTAFPSQLQLPRSAFLLHLFSFIYLSFFSSEFWLSHSKQSSKLYLAFSMSMLRCYPESGLSFEPGIQFIPVFTFQLCHCGEEKKSIRTLFWKAPKPKFSTFCALSLRAKQNQIKTKNKQTNKTPFWRTKLKHLEANGWEAQKLHTNFSRPNSLSFC